jgi:TonB family protein
VPRPRLRLVALLVSLTCAPAFGQMPPTDSSDSPGEQPVFTPPKLVQRVSAPYPPEALALGVSGTVVLEFDVDEKGAVRDVKVKQGAGHGFDEAATQAVQQFRFTPGKSGETPVTAHVTYAYKFVLKTVSKPKPVAKTEEVVRLKGQVQLRGTRTALAGGKVIAVAKEVGPRSSCRPAAIA